ncbi:MAG: hypothetical protein ABJP90_06435 [Paracoccaceae bacterium]
MLRIEMAEKAQAQCATSSAGTSHEHFGMGLLSPAWVTPSTKTNIVVQGSDRRLAQT